MYPKPDRSDRRPNFTKTAENDALDIGWDEGRLSDGRPFRVEMWAQVQVSYLNCFFSAVGLEHLGRRELQQFLERESLIRFRSEKRYVGGRLMTDASGNQMCDVNVVIGDLCFASAFVLEVLCSAEAGRRELQQLRTLGAEHGPCAMPDQAERFSRSRCLAVFDVTTKPWRLLRASVAMLWLTIPMTSPFRLNMGPPELPASMVASAWKNSARGMVRYAVLGAQRALMEPTLSE